MPSRSELVLVALLVACTQADEPKGTVLLTDDGTTPDTGTPLPTTERPTDTGTPTDTGAPTDTDTDDPTTDPATEEPAPSAEEEEKGGCGCTQGSRWSLSPWLARRRVPRGR